VEEELLLLLQCRLAGLPDGVGGHVNSLSGDIQEAAVQVEFDHLVAGSELGVLGHGHVDWLVFAKDLGHESHGAFITELDIKVLYLGVNPPGDPVAYEVVNAVHHRGVPFC
jgi:hypothetical protein